MTMRIKEKIKVSDAAGWTGCKVISGSPDRWIASISTDSRTIEIGDFFIYFHLPSTYLRPFYEIEKYLSEDKRQIQNYVFEFHNKQIEGPERIFRPVDWHEDFRGHAGHIYCTLFNVR